VDRLCTEFYRNISHELATPLTPIVGYLRLLADEELGAVSLPQGKALRAMDNCVRRLRAVLDNLVDVLALESGKVRFLCKDYDFLDSIRRASAELAGAYAARRVTLSEEFPRGTLPARGDADRLERAIVQLLDNAAKFSPEGGRVGLRVRALETSYELVVADSGAGVPAERAEKVFGAFYQVDGSATREHGGVGVGLAIARRIARGLGGDLRVARGATIAGQYFTGAAFWLTVARSAPAVVLDAISNGPLGAPSEQQKTARPADAHARRRPRARRAAPRSLPATRT
jgi:signal transduction histidine kinase